MSTYATDQQLRDQAASQVADEIAAATSPIQGEISTLEGNQAGALSQIGGLFTQLQPSVQQGAQFIQDTYSVGQANQGAILNAATQRLNQLKNQRAAEAQTLAQQMGGPVAIGEFTEAVDPSMEWLAALGPGQMLHTNAYAQADVAEAGAFAGRVFPLIRIEEEAKTRDYFQDQVKELRKSIRDIESRRTSAVNSRFLELQREERQYELDKAELELSKLRADRDWKASLATIKAEQARIAIAKQEQARLDAQVTGVYKGKPTLSSKELTAQINHMTKSDKLEADRLGLQKDEYILRKNELIKQGQQQAKKDKLADQQLAMEIVDSATTGQSKVVKQTVTTQVDRRTALTNTKAYGVVVGKNPDGTDIVEYFIDREVTVPIQARTPMTDPQKLFNLLVSYDIPPTMARNIVRRKLDMPTYQPGKTSYSSKELKNMPFSQLRSIAIQTGWQPDPKNPLTRKELIGVINSRLRK